jgi:subtilisin family serine protease
MVRVVRSWGLLALAALSFVLPSSALAALERRIVVFTEKTPAAQRVALARGAGGRVVRELPLISAVVIEHDTQQVSVAEGRLRALKEVRRVDEDPKINWLLAADAPGVDFAAPSAAGILKSISALKSRARQDAPPAPPAEPAQETPWGIARVKAPEAWAVTKGAGVKVVVIDTGIERSHPDLASLLKGGWNAIDKSDEYNDDNGHGTHCAGTIAALDDDKGVVGVAPAVDLYGVKVLDAGGSGTFDDVIAGMQWAVDNKMQVASMSLGASRGNPALEEAVKAMEKAGVLLIAAAGNSGGSVGYPAGYPGAVAVAASDSGDKLAYFSSRGPQVAVIAPGVDVKSTYPGGTYDTLSGTSMATPHVSGLAALYFAAHPGATAAQARAALAAASSKLPTVPDIGQGSGLPTADRLVR